MNRREFIKHAGLTSLLVSAGDLVKAQSVSDYKALVCVFLYGGNDAFSTVIATDTASWNAYASTRGSIALMPQGTAPDATKALNLPESWGGVLPLSPVAPLAAGRSLALHPKLTKMTALFNSQRRIGIVANVGPLTQPITKQQYMDIVGTGGTSKGGVSIPKKLFSHNDQQNTWQAFAPEGATVGWGGALCDNAVGSAISPYSSMSIGNNAVWLSGKKAHQYQISVNGAIAVSGATLYGSNSVAASLRRIVNNAYLGASPKNANHAFMADLGVIGDRAINAESAMRTAFDATNPATDSRIGPSTRLQYVNIAGSTAINPLAQQLQAVARVIASRATLGVGRQIFLVQLGGFDTHDNQLNNHAELMLKLDHALGYFDDTLTALGVQNQVTTFTASDFGRTFTSNGDGTDHGWGAHHFVMGGSVSGGKIYGTLPSLGLKNAANNYFDSSDDQLYNGVLLPTTSVDQFGATLGKWFGATNLDSIFPNLKNFSSKDLGFLG